MAGTASSGDGNSWQNPVERLRQEFERLLEGALTQSDRALDKVGLKDFIRPAVLPVDVLESADQVQVFVDIPGIDAQQVEITLAGNMLTIKAERGATVCGTNQTLHRNERPAGALLRSLPLPVAVDPNKVSAEARLGTLIITLAKEEKTRPHSIRVHVQPG